MLGVRFYFDYGDKKAKRKGGDAPNALAIATEQFRYDSRAKCRMYDAFGALTFEPNSPVCGTSASEDYIRESCKRCSEAEAYRIHPNLKRYLAAVD